MFHSFNTAAIIAIASTSLASTSPTAADVQTLEPVTKEDLRPSTVSALHGLNKRENSIAVNFTVPANTTILAPISKEEFMALGATPGVFNSIGKRDGANATITPHSNVTLYFASTDPAASNVVAELNATMKYPTVLLEDVATISAVSCSASSVAVTFGDATTFASSLELWSSKAFIMFTNHMGNCSDKTARGIFMVSSVTSDSARLVITARSVETSFDDCTENMEVSFLTPPKSTTTTVKRDLLSAFTGIFPSDFALTDGTSQHHSSTLGIKSGRTSVDGSLGLSGHVSFNFKKLEFRAFYFDLDLSASLATEIEVHAGAFYETRVHTYTPLDVTVAAFSIAGVLSVGPQLSFEVGVEVGAEGSVNVSTRFAAVLEKSVVHLDLLNSTNSHTAGWRPTFTQESNITAAVEIQVNPYVQLTAAIGASVAGGLIDLTAGMKVKPMIINAFDVSADFDMSNSHNITFAPSRNETCSNGLWYASNFVFEVSAFAPSVFKQTLYAYTEPIYKSKCWNWA